MYNASISIQCILVIHLDHTAAILVMIPVYPIEIIVLILIRFLKICFLSLYYFKCASSKLIDLHQRFHKMLLVAWQV